ncbi:hypothetical protein [Maribacter litoralis]|uniref:hypothetical protein n=1 Tax=Maribacter litoralis TaxID=2059726 RepID=UPI000E321668|nr:hypothetical protein [Maribacter litoralis]
MNVKDFTYFLENPTKVVEPIHTKHLEDIIAEYPYFQAARALHLKGLKNLNSYKYNKALKTTAAFTTDRDVLFEFITSKDFLQYDAPIEKIAKIEVNNAIEVSEDTKEVSEIDKIVSVEKEDTSNITEDTNTPEDTNSLKEPISEPKVIKLEEKSNEIDKTSTATLITPSEDSPLPQDEKDAEQILDPELFQSKNPETTEEEDALDIGKPLTFDAKEKYSFSEWLSLASKKPLEKSGDESPAAAKEELEEEINQAPTASIEKRADTKRQETEIANTKEAKSKPIKKARPKNEAIKKKYDRIDKFIATNPKIVPTEQSAIIDISKSSTIDQNELMTETLARVYLEQKKYKKAIQAFKILSLKYPEKSSFFADRIKAVEKLRKDNK